ncbi:hypothetical protein Ae505Ps2_6327c [Pseudonocardia sp. Ae505_Ps2]|nr:hypothetical protein Ae505Ps2_6327c [Pseudonocardia sp. Ae505_Ps2]
MPGAGVAAATWALIRSTSCVPCASAPNTAAVCWTNV